MSNDRISWTWRHAIAQSDLAATTKHVLLTISLYMNEMGQGCYPTQEDLAKATSLSERAVRKHIELAEAAGWLIRREHGFRGQKWRNHEYEPRWPDAQDVDAEKPDVEEGAEPRSGPFPEGAEPDDTKVRNHVPPNVPDTNSNASLRSASPRENQFDDLQDRLFEAAGLSHPRAERHPGLIVLAPILGLIEAGYSLEADILPVIRARAATGFKPRTWAYYVDAIRDGGDRRKAIAAQSKPATPEIDWPGWCEVFFLSRTWNTTLGPNPDYPGCKAPPDVIERARSAALAEP